MSTLSRTVNAKAYVYTLLIQYIKKTTNEKLVFYGDFHRKEIPKIGDACIYI